MKQVSGTDLARTILMSAGVALLAGLLLCGLMGLLANLELLTVPSAQWLGVLAADGILLLCCWYAAERAGKRRLQTSGAVAVVYLLMLLLGKAVFFSGRSGAFDWRMLVPIASALAACLLAGRRKERRR